MENQNPQNPPEHFLAQVLQQVHDAIPSPDGRVIDVLGETVENPEEDILLGSDLPLPRTRRGMPKQPKPVPYTEPELPASCHGAGCLSRAMLVDTLVRCAADRGCRDRVFGQPQREE